MRGVGLVAVIADGVSVLVLNETVEARLPGGVCRLESESPNRTFCTDGEVCRIGFMVMDDAVAYVRRLVESGFTAVQGGHSRDIALADQDVGFLWPCDYLEFDGSGPLAAVRRVGSRTLGVAVASNDQEFKSQITIGSTKEFEAKFEHVETSGRVEVYRDRSTGELVYVGRTMDEERGKVSAEMVHAQDFLAMSERLVNPDVYNPPRWMFRRVFWRRKLRRALSLLEDCVEAAPWTADAHFWIGTIRHALGDSHGALDAFDRALVAQPREGYILTEATVAALSAGLYDTASALSEICTAIQPQVTGVRNNLAIAYLLSGRIDDALTEIRTSNSLSSGDQNTTSLLELIEGVSDGSIPRPRDMKDLQSAT